MPSSQTISFNCLRFVCVLSKCFNPLLCPVGIVSKKKITFCFSSTSYHQNRRQTSERHHDRERFDRDRQRDRLDRERDRERYDRIDRDRERERERLHARQRDLMHYDLNSTELLEERNYGADYPPQRNNAAVHGHLSRGGHLLDDTELMNERDDLRLMGTRYPTSSTRIDPRDLPPSAPTTRRGAPIVDRDEYSPHRGGGSSRRMLNAM